MSSHSSLRGYPADVTTALGTLGINDSISANSETVKKKYKQLVAKFHPDVPGGSDVKMKSVNTAYDVIRKYEEQNGGSLKPSTCAPHFGSKIREHGFNDEEEKAFREQVRRHSRSFHIRHDDEDAFETFHDFVFGGGLKQNFHTVEFKQRSARRRKPTVYDEYKYFTSFEENGAEDRFFEENDDYMNDFSEGEDRRSHMAHQHNEKSYPQNRNAHYRTNSQKKNSRHTFFDEYQNDANYQQREQYIDDDEVFYSPNRFYGTQHKYPNCAKSSKKQESGFDGRNNSKTAKHFRADHVRKGHNQNRRRSSYNMDDSPIDFM
ncbi:hypothetical protein XU18_4855 [Perkinsela sp. CCAP 1560/4]|nr:hypothetical protein XU18_4855 [Perkinsela sp. CCAP 1560/4]|eukprot:KNH03779.1 hypothetical protein XU18_4855 [Perkinsela sp. CCAP 1560/4]